MDFNRRYRIADKAKYRIDPEHKNKPKEGTWYQTEKGWSTSKPKGKSKGEGEKKQEEPTAETPTVQAETPVSDNKEVADKQEKAAKSIEEYYGEIDPEEKKQVEEESLMKIADYIKKVANGEKSDLPELSEDEKKKFIECVFITMKAKQIESIPAATEALGKQRNEIVKNLIGLALDGFDSIAESLSVKGLTEKHISPSEPESIFKVPEKSDKDVSEMTDEEFSEHLLQKGKRDFQLEFVKKPSMRGKSFEDIPQDYKAKAKQLASTNAIYAENFGKFNPELAKIVKVKSGSGKVGFIMNGYKENSNSYYSDVTVPADAFDKMPDTLNGLMQTLGASGFKGRIELNTDERSVALNKNTIRVFSDDPRHLSAANEIAKEAFRNQGISVKTQIVKKQFGMTEDSQFAYRSKLKMLARKSKKTGRIAIPPSDAQNYMIAARLSGYDLVPSNGKYALRKHDASTEVGSMKLDTNEDPKEALKRLNDAAEEDAKPSETESVPVQEPFSGFETMRDIQRGLREENRDVSDEIDTTYGDDFDNPRLEELVNKRSKKHKKKTPLTEEPSENPAEPVKEEKPFSDTLKDTVTAIDEKVKAKDQTVVDDFDAMLQGIQKELQTNPNGFLLKQYQKAVNMSAASLLKGGYTQKMSADTAKRFEDVNSAIKQALVPPVPKTAEQLDLDKLGKHTALGKDEAPVTGKEITGDDGYPTGWIVNGNSLYSSDFGHKMEFDNPESAEGFAKKNPYLDNSKHLQIDPLDKEEVKGDDLVTTMAPDTSRMSSFTSKYGIDDNAPALRELLGFKRLLLSKMGNEDRIKARENGFGEYLSKESAEQLQKDFIDKMSKGNHGDGFDEAKKQMASIDPHDFVKMVSLIGKGKTASFKRRYRLG